VAQTRELDAVDGVTALDATRSKVPKADAPFDKMTPASSPSAPHLAVRLLLASLCACACASASASVRPAPRAPAAPLQPPSWASCCGAGDALCAAWATVTFSPASPQAGDTLVVNASGAMGSGSVLAAPPLATGAVEAYHAGEDVFGAPISTCGETKVSVLGIVDVTIDALPCPTSPNERVALVVTCPIPLIARGMGSFNVSLNATDNSGALVAFCLDVVVTV
jgi:hypothetical protein